MERDHRAPESERRRLDAQCAQQGDSWWDAFYSDRKKPCPFFVDHPDEKLVHWIDQGVIPPGRAIDLGCGNARNAIHLASKGFSVEALDFSEKAIDWAKEAVAEAGAAVELIRGDVFEVALPNAGYDLICDSGCFHHLPPHRRAQYVGRVASALRSGGQLYLACFRPEGGSGYSDEEVYERRSLGGGLGYSERRLLEIWSPALRIVSIEQFVEHDPSSGLFGKSFLWAMLAHK